MYLEFAVFLTAKLLAVLCFYSKTGFGPS